MEKRGWQEEQLLWSRRYCRGQCLWNVLHAKLSSSSPPETTSLILQTLLTITSQEEGAKELLSIRDITTLVEITSQYSLALDILRNMWTNAATIDGGTDNVRESINRIIPSLLLVFKETDGVTLMSSINDLLPKLEPSVSIKMSSCNLCWRKDRLCHSPPNGSNHWYQCCKSSLPASLHPMAGQCIRK